MGINIRREKEMIKEKELNNDLETVRVGQVHSLVEARGILLELAQANEVAIEVATDTVKTKGFFNSQEIPCLVISHPDHQKDYYKMVVLVGNGEIMVASTGVSKQMKKFNIAEANKQLRKGKAMSFKVGNMVTSSLFSLGKSKDKLAEETAYYDTLMGMVGACFEVV